MNTSLVLSLLILLFAYFLSYFLLSRKSKHKYNRGVSLKVLNKINSFEHPGQKINYLRKINPFVFEELVLDAFEAQGYTVIRNKRYTGDGGIDGKLIKDGKTYLIQAKRYSSYINPKHIVEFNEKVTQTFSFGYFIHTGKTGRETFITAKQHDKISIISGEKLINLINNISKK